MHRVFLGLIIVGFAAVAVSAGPLATDTNAWTDSDNFTWHGSTTISNSGTGDNLLEAEVDWCVYPDSDAFFDSHPDSTYTPTPNEFVYVYQVFPQADSLETNKFWVVMWDSNEANNIGDFEMSNSTVATDNYTWASSDPDDHEQAIWEWNGTLADGEVSYGLAYSSINAPIWESAFIQDGGEFASPTGPTPSPSDVIPEPATLTMLGLGGLAAVIRRRK